MVVIDGRLLLKMEVVSCRSKLFNKSEALSAWTRIRTNIIFYSHRGEPPASPQNQVVNGRRLPGIHEGLWAKLPYLSLPHPATPDQIDSVPSTTSSALSSALESIVPITAKLYPIY